MGVCDESENTSGKNYFFDDCDSDTVEDNCARIPAKEPERTVLESKIASVAISREAEEVNSQELSPGSNTAKAVVNMISSSLDLIKGYDFSDDDEDEEKIEEDSSKLEPEVFTVPDSSDDSGPEEISSKEPIVPVVSELVKSPVNCGEKQESGSETLSKNQTRKRKKRREKKTDEEEVKDEKDKPASSTPKYKRFRPPTLLEKVIMFVN